MDSHVEYFDPNTLLDSTNIDFEYHIGAIKTLIARNMKGDRPTVSALKTLVDQVDRHYRYLDVNDMRDDKVCYAEISSPYEGMEELELPE